MSRSVYDTTAAAGGDGCHWNHHSRSMWSCWQETSALFALFVTKMRCHTLAVQRSVSAPRRTWLGPDSVLAVVAWRRFVRNKANSRRRRAGGGLGDERQMCKTNPIRRWAANIRGANRAKRTQFPSADRLAAGPIVRNKAKRRWAVGSCQWSVGRPLKKQSQFGSRGHRAKQSQFGSAPRDPGTGCAKQSQFSGEQRTPPFHHSSIPTRCQSCETKPKAVAGSRQSVVG